MINLQSPPMLQGDEAQQLVQVRNYLYSMAQQLNRALNSLDETNFAQGSAAQRAISGGASEAVKESLDAQATNLKSLIIKTANTVRAEIDKINTKLESDYVASSDFGSFSESVTTEINATAAEVSAVYDYYTQVDNALGSLTAEFDSYVVETSGSIKAGIVEYDGLTPVFGVAVGQDITTKTVVIDGAAYEEIEPNKFLSVFTATKLSFRENNVEVAYLSNEKLYITAAHISSTLELNQWELSTKNGFTIKWIGG